MEKFQIPIKLCSDTEKGTVGFFEHLTESLKTRPKEQQTYLDDVENFIKSEGHKIKEHRATHQNLEKRIFSLYEYNGILEKIKPHLPKNFKQYSNVQNENDMGPNSGIHFHYAAGVVSIIKKEQFQRQIFRASRNNAMSFFFDLDLGNDQSGEKIIQRDEKGNEVTNNIYFIIYNSGNSGTIHKKIRNICSSTGGNSYTIPDDSEEMEKSLRENTVTLRELQDVKLKTEEELKLS